MGNGFRLPIYQQQSSVGGFINARAEAPRMSDPIGIAIGNVGKGLNDLDAGLQAQEMADAQLLQKQQKANDELTALKNVSQASQDLQQTIEQMKGSAAPGATGFTGQVTDVVRQYVDNIRKQGGSEYYLQQFERHMLPVSQSLVQGAMHYEAGEARNHRLNLVSDAIGSSAKTVSQNPGMFEVELGRITSMLDADKDNPFGLLPHQREAAIQKARETLGDQAIWRMVQDNPAQAKATIMKALTGRDVPVRPGAAGTVPAGAPGGFDSAVNWVLGVEGGYNPKDGASGAPVNFGINQRANPDIDVKNLTRDGAIQLYRDRYWAAINADNLPPQTAMVAFDTAVNMGVPTAKRLLAETNGDPAAMIARRKEIYTSLADVPAQRGNLPAWLSRLDKLQEHVGSIPGTPEQPDPVHMDVDPTRISRTGNPAIDVTDPRRLEHWLQIANTEMHRIDTNARQALDRTFADHVSMLKDGIIPPNQLTREQILAAYQSNPVEGLQKADTYADAMQVGRNIGAMKMLPGDKLVSYLQQKPDPNSTNYARESRLLASQAAAAEEILKQRDKDFVAWAAQNKVGAVNPINWADPKSIDNELRNRVVLGKQAVEWGNQFRVLSENEAMHFATYLSALQPQDMARVLGQVRQAGGPEALRSISEQLKDKNMTLSIAGMLAAHETQMEPKFIRKLALGIGGMFATGGDFSGVTPGRNVAQLYLEGKDILAHKIEKLNNTAEVGDESMVTQELNNVYFTPQARNAALDATLAIYAKLKSERQDDWREALRLATGGIMVHNGGKIAKPYGWTDGQFREALRTTAQSKILAASPEFMAGNHKVAAADLAAALPGAKLQTYGDGSYVIMTGNDVVRTKDGKPFVLEINEVPTKEYRPTPYGGGPFGWN